MATSSSKKNKVLAFLAEDHRFVFLGTSALCAFAVALSSLRWPLSDPSQPLVVACRVLCAVWILASCVAGVYKLTHWQSYEKTSPFVQPEALRRNRRASYIAWAAAAVLVLGTCCLALRDAWTTAATATSNPSGFVEGGFYMLMNQAPILWRGFETTILLAFWGTILAFLIALLLVFLRIQTPDRCDNYLVRLFKRLGSGFAKAYSTVIRGTPMMVQGLVIYYGGFALFSATGMPIRQVQNTWTFFIAGLVTISICSAAYMAEVLRASIEAIDPGQTEAARSLGLSQWQAMSSIVFPQGVRNAMPAISNELIVNIKDSSVLSVIGVFDLMYATTSITGIYFRQMEVYIAIALIYLALTWVAGKLLDAISARMGMQTRSVFTTQHGAGPVAADEILDGDDDAKGAMAHA
jgi:putative lysine transport system permease protein